MKKIALLTLAVFLMQGWTFALTYDPATNSYVTDAGETVTGTTTTTSDASTTQPDTPTTPEVEVTQQDAVVIDNTWNGTLEYIHDELDDNTSELLTTLKSSYRTLKNDMDDLFGDNEQSRLASLQCLNIIDDEFDILDQVEVTYKQLVTKVEIVATDIHSEISALEKKIDDDLLDDLDKKLQVAAAQNKVDAFNTEYANVINTFYDLSRDELADVDLIVDQEKDKYAEVLKVYDRRVALYENLEDEYTTFLSKSSFAGALAGPNMQELLESIHDLEVYYRSKFIADWKSNIGAHIPDNNTAFKETSLEASLLAFSNTFSAKADGILGGLYPVEKLQLMHNSMLTIRAAYLHDNGSYDCQAFATNKTIDNAADELIEDMDILLTNLNIAVNKVATDGTLPKTVEELKVALQVALQSQGDGFIDVLIQQEKARLEVQANREGVSWLSVGLSSESARRERTVRTFLQSYYKKALDDGTISTFQTRMQRAHAKIETVIEQKKPEGRTLGMLLAIKTVIEEFME